MNYMCVLTVSLPRVLDSTNTVNKQWLRLEAKFMGVSAIARLVSPRNKRFNASSSLKNQTRIEY